MRRYLILPIAFMTSTFLSPPALAAVSPASVMPGRMTAFTMFMNADIIVKIVMLLLICASITTWAICLSKCIEFRNVGRAIRGDKEKLVSAPTLDKVPPLQGAAGAAILAAAREEVAGCVDLANPRSGDAMTERLSIRLAATEGDAIQSMRTGFSVLASIGATSPFIGLLGTVWGIMNSFVGISQAQTSNLAVVAPGIAEALLATALGLVAAIPAVLLYNVFSRQMASFRRDLHNVSSRVACLVSHASEQVQVGHRKLAV